MSLICCISNEVPDCPVVSKISGHVFEKRLIEKHLLISETDPIDGRPLTMDDLIEIKAPSHVRPKPPTATSIPALLKSFQDEWDALMLHTFAQKQQIQTLKQELSHSLYQYDASCRVMARLTKEVTAAREALATLKPQAGVVSQHITTGSHAPSAASASAPDSAADQEETTIAAVHNVQQADGITPEIDSKLAERSQLLTAERKKRGKQMPAELAPPEVVGSYGPVAVQTGLHSSSLPGILCLDMAAGRIVTGGNDRTAVVYDVGAAEIVSVLRGHTKKVTAVVLRPAADVAVSGSADATVRVWRLAAGGQTQSHVVRAHAGPVTGLSLHATGDYVLSASVDGHWAFSDIDAGRVLLRLQSRAADGVAHRLTCMKSHPDGLIAATGADDGELSIWSLREAKKAAFFNHGGGGALTAIAFSENGFYLATGGSDGLVKLWDLRKVREFKTLSPGDGRGYQICDLQFDQSGSYLGVAGSDVRLYQSKQWDTVATFSEHTAVATGVRFGEHARSVVSCSLDRTVQIYGLPEGR